MACCGRCKGDRSCKSHFFLARRIWYDARLRPPNPSNIYSKVTQSPLDVADSCRLSVKTLVLDGMASVTNDLLHELVTSSEYDIRLLSIRRCPNVNQYKLQQLLQYACRPGRSEGNPRLRGLYFFTDPMRGTSQKEASGVTALDGAQLGALPTNKSLTAESAGYYTSTGRMVQLSQNDTTFWAQTIAACKGIIWFDAVLCSHMHTEMEPFVSDHIRNQRPAVPTMATIALGPSGCSGCGRGPHDGPVWGESPIDEFPLLWPPAASGSIIDAVRPPSGPPRSQRLIVSCQWCIDNRHCDSCHRWWCSDCYNPQKGKTFEDPENPHVKAEASEDKQDSIKVHEGFCVERCLVPEAMAGAGAGGMWG